MRSTREELDRLIILARRSAKYWRRALLVAVGGMFVAATILHFRPRLYRSEVILLHQDAVSSTDLVGPGSGGESGRRLALRLKDLLLSRSTLGSLVEELGLHPDLVRRHGLVEAAEEVRRHLSFRWKEGDTIHLSYDGADPARAQRVAARLGEVMVAEAARRRREQAELLVAFLDGEGARNAARLREKEDALAQFLVVHPEFATVAAPGAFALPRSATEDPPVCDAPGPPAALLEQQAGEVEDRLDRLVAQAAAAPAPPPLGPAGEPPELVAARRNLERQQSQFTDRHPDVIGARAALRIAEEAAAQRGATAPEPPPAPATPDAAEIESTRRELEALHRRMEGHHAQEGRRRRAPPRPSLDERLARASVDFNRLLREVERAREHQRALDDRRFRFRLLFDSATSERHVPLAVLDPAYRPTRPVGPRDWVLFAAALLGCVALGAATAAASAALDDDLTNPAARQPLDALPPITSIARAGPAHRRGPIDEPPLTAEPAPAPREDRRHLA